ncbi:hypothetical protein M8C21_020258 [Ambrosia artemisiifolia]|uniref:Uncharacterized protein n=1 Tax=Ambrosia artemisiifolia TaxID=4212 RepID=A0AAD5CWD1_AMBAR|nr:hypothetical protein M8C21_020258 [Ambrosia artemisiifolia]
MTTTMLTPPTLLKQEAGAANSAPSTMKTSGAEDEKRYQNRKRRRPPKLVGLKESNSALDGSATCSRNKRVVNSVDDDSRGKMLRSSAGSNGNTQGFVLALEATGSNDGKSFQKRRGGPKLVVKKPTSALKGHGITADLEEQEPLSVWLERMRTLSALKRSACPSPSDRHDKSVNDATATTSGTTADYQQDWPFIKLCPIWAAIESLVPQKPHFSPLKKTNELRREGLALSHMVTYWSLVQRLPDLKPNDPTDIINNSLEVLVELESHGFEVDAIRGRLNEMLHSKSKAGEHDDTLKELEKRNYEKLVIEKEIDQLKVEAQKLQEKMAQAETMRKANEDEIMRLQSKLASCVQPKSMIEINP